MSAKLFLICPTDFIEHTIEKEFGSECYFYTSLGLNFHWDNAIIQDIIKLIEINNINEIILVSNYRNQFYKNYFEGKQPLKSCASVINVYDNLIAIVPKLFYYKNSDQKLFALISKYLQEQENILKRWFSLHNRKKVSSRIYNDETKIFMKPDYETLGFDFHLN